MSEVDTYIKENAEVHQFAAEIARIISGIPQMPEFSSENMSVSDASKLIGLPATSIRAGIVYGWLPIGTAIQNNKPAKSLSGISVPCRGTTFLNTIPTIPPPVWAHGRDCVGKIFLEK